MAFAYTRVADGDTIFGNKHVTMGNFTMASGDTGGDIDTGLSGVQAFIATGIKSWSAVGGVVTVVATDPAADVSNSWIAINNS